MRDKGFELLGLLKGSLKYIITSTFELSSIQQSCLFFLLHFLKNFIQILELDSGVESNSKIQSSLEILFALGEKASHGLKDKSHLHNIRNLLYPQNIQILKMSSMSKLVLVKSALTWRLRCS